MVFVGGAFGRCLGHHERSSPDLPPCEDTEWRCSYEPASWQPPELWAVHSCYSQPLPWQYFVTATRMDRDKGHGKKAQFSICFYFQPWMEKMNTANMLLLPKIIYKFGAIPIKKSQCFFFFNQLNKANFWRYKEIQRAKFKRTKRREGHIAFKLISK